MIMLCDVSGSMDRYSRMLLHFGHALRSRHRRLEVFVFSTHDRFDGEPEALGAKRITTNQLARFMAKRPEILPPRITRWVELG